MRGNGWTEKTGERPDGKDGRTEMAGECRADRADRFSRAKEEESLTREEKYTETLKGLGIYRPAFDAEIKALAELERDLQRMRKAWIAQGGDAGSKAYPLIAQTRRDILAHRVELGLTPRALGKITGGMETEARTEELADNVLTLVREKHRGAG